MKNIHWALNRNGWTLEDLLFLKYEQCQIVYASLPAPKPDELNGEYSGHTLIYMQPVMLQKPYEFLGKAFRPNPIKEGAQGDGYIIWRVNGAIVRNNQFGWAIGPSGIDGKPALIMDWQYFAEDAVQNYGIDEVRRAAPGLYLCTTVNKQPTDTEPIAGRINYWLMCDRRSDWIGPDHEYPLR